MHPKHTKSIGKTDNFSDMPMEPQIEITKMCLVVCPSLSKLYVDKINTADIGRMSKSGPKYSE